MSELDPTFCDCHDPLPVENCDTCSRPFAEAERDRLRGEVAMLLARADADQHTLTQALREAARMRPVYEAAKIIRNGNYSVRLKLTSEDRRRFDSFNEVVDTAIAAEVEASKDKSNG